MEIDAVNRIVNRINKEKIIKNDELMLEINIDGVYYAYPFNRIKSINVNTDELLFEISAIFNEKNIDESLYIDTESIIFIGISHMKPGLNKKLDKFIKGDREEDVRDIYG